MAVTDLRQHLRQIRKGKGKIPDFSRVLPYGWRLEESKLLSDIENLVLDAQEGRKQERSADIKSMELEIDEAVYKLYRLGPEQVELIKDWELSDHQV